MYSLWYIFLELSECEAYPEANSTATLTWQDGNIVSISTIDGRDNETTTFSYTEHPVSYTHLDVYKRQVLNFLVSKLVGEESDVGTQNGEERRNLFL